MIKSLIILVLLVIVLGGSALSRPGEEDFKSWYREQAAAEAGDKAGFFDKLAQEAKVSDYLGHTTYHNRIFWADVEHEGQTAYTGAFSHWFRRSH
jgi:hypothetical protein